MKRRLAMVTALAALLMLPPAVSRVSALEEADRLFLVGERGLTDQFFPVARRALERFVTQYPNDPRMPRAVVMLGKARLALGDPQPALDAFQRAHTFKLAPAELLEIKFWEAETLFRLGRFTEARAAYDEVVRTDAASPLAPAALYGYAWSELELKRPEPAVTAFRDFLTTWPEHALASTATYQLARAYYELKRPDEALPLLTTFATKYPNSNRIPEAQFLLGQSRLATGDSSGGHADLRAFLAAYPNHELAPEAKQLVGQAAAKPAAGTGAPQQAKPGTETGPQQPAPDQPSAEALYEAAVKAIKQGRAKEVDAAWKKMRAQFPDHPRTRQLALELATVAFKQKNWKDASALGQVAAQSDEHKVRAEGWLLVGEAELKQRRFPQAVKAFEAVGGISEVETGVRYRALAGLGLAREEQKEWKAALTAYEAVASRSPDTSLRDWARERAAAVKAQLPKPGNGTPPQKRSEPTTPTPKRTGSRL